MNIDTKYLIRWGIPGWVFLMFVGSVLIYYNFSALLKLQVDLSKALGLLVSLSFFGVPIGYLMHQVYFSFHWISKKNRVFDRAVSLVDHNDWIKDSRWGKSNKRDYFRFEYLWHVELMKLDTEKRDYIAERYRYLLSTIHGLGALTVSLVFSAVIGGLAALYANDWNFNLFTILFIITAAILAFVTYKGFKYYSSNLNHFQGYFFNSFREGRVKGSD